MPSPPSPPALVTAAASPGVLALPIGACRIGHLRLRRSVKAFVGHMRVSSSVRLPVHAAGRLCVFRDASLFLRSRRRRRLEEALLRMRIDLHGIEKNSS